MMEKNIERDSASLVGLTGKRYAELLDAENKLTAATRLIERARGILEKHKCPGDGSIDVVCYLKKCSAEESIVAFNQWLKENK